MFNSQPEPVSLEAYNKWRRDPCTVQLFRGAALGLMEQLFDDSIPVSADAAVAAAFERQGARNMLQTLHEWEPASVKEERKLKESQDE